MRRIITILGAGPAGLTAAINLARAGYPVRVYERRPDVGRHMAGDLEGLENWSSSLDVLEYLRRMGVERDFHCTPITQLTVFNGRRDWQFYGSRPLFYLVRRGNAPGSLDACLALQALKAGAEVLFGQNFGEEGADIVATGGSPKYRFAVDIGLAFQTDLPDIAIGLVNDRAAYKGYAYLLSADGHGCICTCLFDRFAWLNSCFKTTLEMFSAYRSFAMDNAKQVGGIGAFRLHPLYEKEKRLYVGEAAGVQDLLWGFGMRTAMFSGFLAARSIIEGTSYLEVAKKAFDRYLKAGIVNRFLWEMLRAGDYRMIMGGLALTRNRLSLFRSFYNYSAVQHLIYPLAVLCLQRRYCLSIE